MKQTTRWILIAVMACGMCTAITYRIAYHAGYENGYRNGVVREIQTGAFTHSIGFLAALQLVRTNDVAGATRLMEKLCFDYAQIFYKEPASQPGKVSDWGRAQGMAAYPGNGEGKALGQELLNYRAAYRTNSADWDDMERKLEAQLAKLK